MLAALLQLLAAIVASSLALLACKKGKPNGAALPPASPSPPTPSASSVAKPPSIVKSPDVKSPPPKRPLTAAEAKFQKDKEWNEAINNGLERPQKDDESVDECKTDYGPDVKQPKPGEPFSDPMAGGAAGIDSKKQLNSEKPSETPQKVEKETEKVTEKATAEVA